MVHLMRPSNSADIRIVTSCKPFYPLVDDYIVHEEIRNAISHDAEADGLHHPALVKSAEINEQHTWYGEDHEEGIVLFKESRLWLMMVPVQIPKKPMHHILMGEPGHAFHHQEGCQQHCYI